MEKLSAANLVSAINQLDKAQTYQYINPKTKGLIKIVRVDLPNGPIIIRRWNPSKKETYRTKKDESISTEMLWRIANAFTPEQPINFDRVLGGSYNTRSVLETLLAHSPMFYTCKPGRLEVIAGYSKVKPGHKHIVWIPDNPHKPGEITSLDIKKIISEIPTIEAVYDNLQLPKFGKNDLNAEELRTHAFMQVALWKIGLQLGFRTYIANNDKGIIYDKKRLVEHEGIIISLNNENLMKAQPDAAEAAKLIDCMWFKNGKLMPAVMEIEHSTGVTSGLTRMKKFKDLFPPFPTRYVIVAADELRDKVESEARAEIYKDLQVRFFPYSAVQELLALCQKRRLKGITEEFLDCYMEPITLN